MKRILSLDGGGIKGALTLGFLQKIEDILRNRCKNIISPEQFRLYQYFDMIGGTSTGSIIAAAPTYFAPQLLNVGNNITGVFIDGGVSMANNPALELIKVATMKGFGYQWPIGADKLLLISIGTGNTEYFSKTTEVTDNWVLNWATEIPSMLMSDARNCDVLYDIGQAAAEKDIEAIDFLPVFDLKK